MGHTPYGYRIENGQAVIDEEKTAAVRKLLEGYLSGLGLAAAAEAAGIKATHTQVKHMLTNEKYLGNGYYPAIMTREEREAVKTELDKRARALGRIYERESSDVEYTSSLAFTMPVVTMKYEDPYEQAAYAFSLIEEVKIDG
ncbi:MAG: recombinase [Hominisplanchenecus sp.]|nr:recombinase [Hominisplanchenecus sp.]